MTDYAAALPARMKTLRRDKHGRPVPWFVAVIDGQPDFRVIRENGINLALRHRWCWVCGKPLSAWAAFVIGPMCALNRTSAEPASHRQCAIYSALHCPFLTTPSMVRRDRHKPEDASNPAGEMITRNPGVAGVWIQKTGSIRSWSPAPGEILFDLGDPSEVLWYAHARAATRSEVLESIDTGLPILAEMAEEDGPDAIAELGRQHERALKLVPPS